MIPTTATDADHERYVSNIIAVWHRATPAQMIKGRGWYPAAHALAGFMTDGDVKAGAGVIAALSANKPWAQNTRMAADAFTTGTPTGHVGNALGKAAAIMAGADPVSVLPMSLKTGMFYRSILDPADPDAVVIDRHAHDIAVGVVYGNDDRGLSSKTRYATLAHAYREAARRLGELPLTVQAVIWTVQTESLAGVGPRAGRKD